MRRFKGLVGALLLASPLGACSGGDGGKDRAATPTGSASTVTALQRGPLQDSLDGGSLTRIQGPVDKRCRVSFGDAFENDTDKPVDVISAEFGSTEGATVLGIMKQPQGSYGVGNPPGFPPRELKRIWPEVRELAGSTVQPGEFVWLVYGLQLESDRGSVSNLAIEYEIGGRRYRAVDNDVFHAVEFPERGLCPQSLHQPSTSAISPP